MNCKIRYLLIVVTIICMTITNSFAAEPKSRILDMAKKLANMQKFSVTMHMTYDVVQNTGQKIEFSELRKTTVQRPDHLRVEAVQSDGDKSLLIFDGKVISLLNVLQNVYSQTSHPGDIDSTFYYADEVMRMRVPLGWLLVSTLAADLDKLISDADYVERNTLDKEATDHIVGRTNDVDYQLWIRDDNLPSRIVLTYKKALGQPQFRAEFSNWNTAPPLTDKVLIFTPPTGAEKIPALLLAPETNNENKNNGGAK